MSTHTDPTVRHDIFFIVEALNCNPNGDPDLNNHPRVDEMTGQAIMTDVSIKRKVRDGYLALGGGDADQGKGILIQKGELIVTKTNLIADAAGEKATNEEKRRKAGEAFFDARMFGAVFTGSGADNAKSNFGQKIGPVQIDFARSVLPVEVEEVAIVRVAQASDADKEDYSQMGRKFVVPHALMVIRGTFSPRVDKEKLVTSEDLSDFYDALVYGFANCRTTSKNFVPRRLLVASHDSDLGSAPRYVIEDLIQVSAEDETTRSYKDYDISIGEVPSGITLHDLPIKF